MVDLVANMKTAFCGVDVSKLDDIQYKRIKDSLDNVKTYREDLDCISDILNALKTHKKGDKPLDLSQYALVLQHLNREYKLADAIAQGVIDVPPINNQKDFDNALNYLLKIREEKAPHSQQQELAILKALLEYKDNEISGV